MKRLVQLLVCVVPLHLVALSLSPPAVAELYGRYGPL